MRPTNSGRHPALGASLSTILLGLAVLVAGCASNKETSSNTEGDRDYASVSMRTDTAARTSYDAGNNTGYTTGNTGGSTSYTRGGLYDSYQPAFTPPPAQPLPPADTAMAMRNDDSADEQSGEQASLIAESGIATEAPASDGRATYSEGTILDEAEQFFGDGAEGLADVVRKVFDDRGPPDAFIKGTEVSGAIGVGLRYGEGELHGADGTMRTIYWKGPSVGLDIGGNAAKAFILVYGLKNVEDLYQRYPGVEGSLYFVGGVGVNYNQAGDTTLAPMRFGVGWRQGLNIGYLHLHRDKSLFPF